MPWSGCLKTSISKIRLSEDLVSKFRLIEDIVSKIPS
jgi:hypothetical protein